MDIIFVLWRSQTLYGVVEHRIALGRRDAKPVVNDVEPAADGTLARR